MSSRAIIAPATYPSLEVVSAEMRGQTYQMTGHKLTIGRSETNDIVLDSEGVSRFHATIERTSDGTLVVRDNRSKNGVQVNGIAIVERSLQEGDLVQVGSVLFRFHTGEAELEPEPLPPALSPSAAGGQAMAEYEAQDAPGVPWGGAEKKKRSKRPLIYGALGLILLLVYYSQNETPKEQVGEPVASADGIKKPDLKGPGANSTTSTLEDPIYSKAETENSKLDWQNSPLREAEQHFKRGLREFSNKNYHRAMEAFNTALSMNRSHELADYYLRLTIYEAESEAKRQYAIGVKYFESLQYSRAIYHFKEAAALMSHRRGEKTAVDAEKYIQQCQRRLQAAELFP